VTLFAFYGTFASGQPGHGNLAGAEFVERTRTAPRYRLFRVDRRWPALVPSDDGVAIECELYECSEALLERLAALEPAGWNRSPVELEDGRLVDAFLGDAELAARGRDVSAYGSWAAFLAAHLPEPVVVVDYDPEWPRLFAELRERLLAALEGVCTTVEHVGSTAVPGLAAKPVVDMDAVVSKPEDVPVAVARLEQLGYEHVGDGDVPGRAAFHWPPAEHRHHLYVVVEGTDAHRRHLLFRDYLRTHPDEAQRYGELKRALSRRYRDDRPAYTDGKDEFVARVLAAAEREL